MISVGVGTICFLIGMLVGAICYYFMGEPKCKHEWEKIVDDKPAAGSGHIVIHMCKKCGRRKYTKIIKV
jgi:hypothetical protein